MNRVFCHHDGATAIMKARRQRGSLVAHNQDLDKLVRRQVLRSALLRRIGIPAWLEDGALFGETGVPLELDRFVVQIIRIQSEAEGLSADHAYAMVHGDLQLPASSVESLLEEANRLDCEMQLWVQSVSREWWYQTHVIDDKWLRQKLYGGLYGDSLITYSSLGHAVVWNRYRTVRIMLKGVTLRLLRLLETYHGHDVRQSIQIATSGMQALISDICASVPYSISKLETSCHFEEGDTMSFQNVPLEPLEMAAKRVKTCMMGYMVFPFHSILDALQDACISDREKDWIKERISRVGRLGNDAIIEKLANRV